MCFVMARMVFPTGSSHMSYGLYIISDGFGTICKWLLYYAIICLCHVLRFQSRLMIIRLRPMLFWTVCMVFLMGSVSYLMLYM